MLTESQVEKTSSGGNRTVVLKWPIFQEMKCYLKVVNWEETLVLFIFRKL